MYNKDDFEISFDDVNSRYFKAFELSEAYTTRTALTVSTIAGVASVIYSPYIQDTRKMINASEVGVVFANSLAFSAVSLTFAAVSGSVLIAIAGSKNVKRISERFALRAAGLGGFKTLESARLHRQKLRDQLQSRP